MPRRALKTFSGKKKYIHVQITEEEHAHIIDIAIKNNISIKALVLASIQNLFAKD